MIIAIDFDQTICNGLVEVDGAVEWIKKFQAAGAKTILWTNRQWIVLKWAIAWCKVRGITFDAVNTDLHWWQKIFFSGKVYADLFIDDRNAGCPLKNGCVDWSVVGPCVMEKLHKGGQPHVRTAEHC